MLFLDLKKTVDKVPVRRWLKQGAKESTFVCTLCKTGELDCGNKAWQSIVQKKDDRLQKLEFLNPDSHKAVQWLRKHKKLFKADVYEPFILLISIKDDNVKNLLYSIVPRCDLEALFLFEDLDDMFIFIDECHKKHKWIVHVSTIPDINLKKLKKTT
ncbi:unnamed protein product [Didymodactylos carnosus]|uniref:Uncharacterized protein n=1 Tax=Didymodactylos carnosus TaxID=1234261 RepID=A0A8S2HZ20_9BILA|nr:unnamed protein product [Didymodactylos carnosus]CAF3698870.1 unnamed protein product [Didymodactylos carnosus]